MDLLVSRGKLNGDPMSYPVVEKGVTLRSGSSYVRDVFTNKMGPGETPDQSVNGYTRSLEEVGRDYEPSLDLYLAWCNALVRDSKHLQGRVYFKRAGREHVFAGGRNVYAVYALDEEEA